MKKIIISILIMALVILTPALCAAQVELPGYEGGIQNEFQYKEMFFLTGRPIELSGTVQVKPGRTRGDQEEIRYTYKLENQEEEVRINRTVTVTNTVSKYENQTITKGELTKYSETLRIGGQRYDLEDYTMYRSVVTDHQPAIDYYSGNWTVRKVYSINRGEGRTIVETVGELVGYKQAWGDTETQKMSIRISSERNRPENEEGNTGKEEWSGTIDLITSINRTRDLTYVPNLPTQISFEGGYLLTEQEESVLNYTYNLPNFDEDGSVINYSRNRGENTISLTKVPTQKRLPIPQVKDVRGHWAEADIMRLYSLGVFDWKDNYFGARLPMTRSQFARAIALTLELKPKEEKNSVQSILGRNNANQNSGQSKFSDVPVTHPDYPYVQLIEEKGIIAGIGGGLFGPDKALTRAQAITIIIRALGLQVLAPTPGYSTGYRDDNAIPSWARDEIYVAKELGLVVGSGGYLYPNEIMTRAETAVLLNKLITYLQKDLRNDYRERIIYYR
ncbi:MAG TPA: S-layer homology domain-containing protein [Clostridia bacterium]|nr:S-layer homology domain-containing protein [Clostridia bacterium]